MNINLVLSIVGLIVTIAFGIIPIIISYRKGDLWFSKKFPFIHGPISTTLKNQQTKQISRQRRLFRILIPVFSLVCLVVAFLIIKLFLFQEVAASQRRPVAVILFKNETGDNSLDYLGEAIPNLLITNLEQSKYLTVMTWERMYDLLKTIGKENVKTIEKELAFEICRKDGIDAVIVGSFIRTGDMFAIDAKVLDVESKKLLHSYSTKGEGIASILKTQIDELSRQISRGVGLSERKVKESPQNIMEVTTNSMDAYRYYLQGRDAYDKRYYYEAQKSLEKAIAIDSTLAMAYLILGDAMEYQGNANTGYLYEKARQYSYKTSEKERMYIDIYYDYYLNRDIKQSIMLLKQLVKQYPKEKRAYMLLANCFSYLRLYDDYFKYWQKVLELDPNSPYAVNEIAYYYLYVDKYDKAYEYYQRYIALLPDDADPYDSMGDFYFYIGRLPEAIEYYKKALAVKPDFGSDTKIAYIYAIQEDYDETFKWLDQYLAVNRSGYSKTSVLADKGFYYYWVGNYTKSLSTLNQYNKFHKKLYETYSSLSYAELGQFERARAHCQERYNIMLETSVQKNMTFVYKNIRLSLIDISQGLADSIKTRLATIKLLLPTLEMDEFNKRYLPYCRDMIYAELLVLQDSLDKAIEVVKNILPYEIKIGMFSLAYNHPFFIDVLARCYSKKGETDKAIQEYERIITFNPQSKDRRLIYPKYHYRLGKLYEQKGLPEKALEQYNKFLSIDKYADVKMPELIDAKTRIVNLNTK